MFRCFYPDYYIDSTYEIDFKSLYQAGYRGIIFDVDNTLVPHGADADDRAMQLFDELRAIGFQCVLLSNNKEPRVKKFADAVKGVQYIYKAGKPKVINYQKAIERMNIKSKETMFIGDQLFTDIWGAKRTGIYNILVKPIHPKEEIQIVLKRYLEKIVLFFYLRNQKKGKNNDVKWTN